MKKPDKTARECALSLLEYAPRTEREIRRKLKDREFSSEEIEEALAFLTEYGYVNDAEYAKVYICVNASRKSRRQIQASLGEKGIARDLIGEALEHCPVEEEEQIRRLLEKKGYEPGERLDAVSYRRLMGSLGRKGFSGALIRRVMEQMRVEDPGFE